MKFSEEEEEEEALLLVAAKSQVPLFQIRGILFSGVRYCRTNGESNSFPAASAVGDG